MKRVVVLSVLAALLATVTSACSTDAQRSKVYITRAGKIVLEPAPHGKGETILRIENDDAAKHKVVLLRLDDGVEPSALPLSNGVLPVGSAGDLEYRGPGYRVVEKLDTMRAFYGGDSRIVSVVHTYLANGRYVLLSNLPGDFARGVWTQFTIGGGA